MTDLVLTFSKVSVVSLTKITDGTQKTCYIKGTPRVPLHLSWKKITHSCETDSYSIVSRYFASSESKKK